MIQLLCRYRDCTALQLDGMRESSPLWFIVRGVWLAVKKEYSKLGNNCVVDVLDEETYQALAEWLPPARIEYRAEQVRGLVGSLGERSHPPAHSTN